MRDLSRTNAGPFVHDGGVSSEFVQHLVRVNPHAGAHRVAARACVSVLVPLLVLWSIGRLEWSIYAAFGAFTSLYGRNHVHLSRSRMQLSLAALLTGSTVLGVAVGLSEHRTWLGVLVAGFVAAVGSLLSDVQDWHPPGPLFLVFAFGACSTIPAEPRDLVAAAVVSSSAALFAVVVGIAGSTWRYRRGAGGSGRRVHRRTTAAYAPRPAGRVAGLHLVRCVVGVLLSGAIATVLGIGHPYWAMVGAVVPLAARDLLPQLVRGAQRVIGTFVGLRVSALLLWVDPRGLLLILVIVLLQGVAELLVGRNYALALVAITPLALLVGNLVVPVPAATLVFDRGVETVIGVVVGVLIAWVTRRRDSAAPA